MKKIFYCCSLFILFSNCSVLSGGDCGEYGEWEYERTSCDANFWCFSKGQKATYKYYIRQKQCRNGIVESSKKEKVKCGC